MVYLIKIRTIVNSYHMKQLYTFIFSLLIAPTLFAQDHCDIHVLIEGFTSSKVQLAYHYGDKQYIKDSTRVVNGEFYFKSDSLLPRGVYMIVLPPDNNYFEIIVSSDQQFRLETNLNDLVGSMKVIGSEENRVFFEDIKTMEVFREQRNDLQEQLSEEGRTDEDMEEIKVKLIAIDKEVNEHRTSLLSAHPDFLYTKMIKATLEPEVPDELSGKKNENDIPLDYLYYKNHYFDNVDFSEAGLLRTPVLHNKLIYYLEKLTYSYADSVIHSVDYLIDEARANPEVFKYVVVTLVNKYARTKVMGHDAVYVHLVDTYYLTHEADWISEESLKKMKDRVESIRPTLLGNKAPDFTALNAAGEAVSLSQLKAAPTLLFFWDYDCGHCKTEIRKLAKVFPELNERGVQLVTVNMNGNVETWVEKLAAYGISYGQNLQDHNRESGADQVYDLVSLPRVFVLDDDKTILAKQISVEQASEFLINWQP